MNTPIQTPSFVFDADVLHERVRQIKAVLFGGGKKLCYAVKANPFLIPDLLHEADAFEVCSPGEYDICVAYGVPPEKIVLSGVYKQDNDIDRIVKACGDKATYTAESPAQFALLARVAKARGVTLPVLLRLSSGNQFGMDAPTIETLLTSNSHDRLRVLGLHYYGGTQKRPDRIEKEIAAVQAFAARLRASGLCECKRIEYGGGWQVPYFVSDRSPDVSESLQQAAAAFADTEEVVLEMGRFLAAGCGTYHTRIVDVKQTDGTVYCITDGGIHHLNYYGQTMAMKVPVMLQLRNGREPAGEKTPHTVCGALCTAADVLVRACPLVQARIGDELVFCNTGAYSVTEGIYLFLSRDMPRIYRCAHGALSLMRDKIATHTLNTAQKSNKEI